MNAESLEKLVLMKMPFGKYAGRALADLPGNYLAWFAREGFPQGELGQLLELMQYLRSQWSTWVVGAYSTSPWTAS